MKRHFGEYHFTVRRLAKKDGVSVMDVVENTERLPSRYLNAKNEYVSLEAHLRQLVAMFPGEPSAIEAQKMLDEIEHSGPGEFDEKAQRKINELAAIMRIEAEVLKEGCIHYFLETEHLAERLPVMLGNHLDPRALDVLLDDPKHGRGILHTTGKQANGILFSINKAQQRLCVVGQRSGYAFLDYESLGEIPHPDDPLALVFGLSLYIRCFPEAVKEGFPEFAKHPAHFKGEKCHAVRTVPQIMERDGPVPHFRNGHFRFLASERFTKKRWQTIFVSESFIKGKAKTIVEVAA